MSLQVGCILFTLGNLSLRLHLLQSIVFVFNPCCVEAIGLSLARRHLGFCAPHMHVLINERDALFTF